MRTEPPWVCVPFLPHEHKARRLHLQTSKWDLHRTTTSQTLDFLASKTIKMKFLLFRRCPVQAVLEQTKAQPPHKNMFCCSHFVTVLLWPAVESFPFLQDKGCSHRNHLRTVSASRVCSHESMNKQVYYQIKCRGVGDEVLFHISHHSLCWNTRVWVAILSSKKAL